MRGRKSGRFRKGKAIQGRFQAVAFHTSKRLVRRRLLRHVGHMRFGTDLRERRHRETTLAMFSFEISTLKT